MEGSPEPELAAPRAKSPEVLQRVGRALFPKAGVKGATQVPLYRCYLLDKNENVVTSPQMIDAPDDRSAMERARTTCDGYSLCRTVAVWDGDRCVGRFTTR